MEDWDLIDAKKPEHVKIVKFLKEQKGIIQEDSISGIAPVKDSSDSIMATCYQELDRRVIEKRMKDSLLIIFRPPIPEWDKPLLADSTGMIGPQILEAYWMNEFGEKITTVASNAVAYLLVRTQCYKVGEKLTVDIKDEKGKAFSTGEKIITRYISYNHLETDYK